MIADRSRRDLLKSAMLAAAIPVAGVVLGADKPDEKTGDLLKPSNPVAGPDRFKGLKVGVASYSFRKVSLEQTIKAIQRVGLHYVSIKDFHLSMKSTAQDRKTVAQAFIDAGITPLSCGNVRLTTDEAASRNAFEYVRDTGAGVMVCAPDPAALPMLEKLVKEFDIKLAIHNHGPEDKTFPSPYEVQKAIANLDPRIGYCIDVGHTARAGVDPAKAMRDLKDRLYDIHLKDVADPKAKNARVEIELGRGKLDIRAMAQALVDIGFTGHVGFEHEKDPIDPLPGLAESVGYLAGVMASM